MGLERSPEAIDTLRVAQSLKEAAVRREGIGTDLPMSLVMVKDGDPIAVMTLMGTRDELLVMTYGIVAIGDADQVVQVIDAYGTLKPDSLPDHGDLARAFGAGDRSVYECLHVTSVRADGALGAIQCPYTYQGRSIVWGEVYDVAEKDPDLEIGGDFPMAMRAGFEAQRTRTRPGLSPAEIGMLLDCEVGSAKTATAGRNRPCPCGSGRKIKHCCRN